MASEIITFLIFFIASIFCFTLPGIFLIQRGNFRLGSWSIIFLGTAIGFIVFTLISYLGILLNLDFLILPLTLIIDLLALKTFLKLRKTLSLPQLQRTVLLFIVFTLGIAGQMAVIAPSGRFINGELVFWSAHGHDSMWHIALMEELKKGFPLQNPVFSAEKLVNYHFFSDITPTVFNQYFHLSNLDLYFRLFPLLYSLLLGSLAYLLGKTIGKTFSAGVWAMVFTYFAGSFGYIVTWIQNNTISGETIFWATQIQSSIGNPPQIAAFIILLSFLLVFFDFIQDQRNWIKFSLCSVLAGSLIEFKVYGGVILLGSLLLIGIYQIIKEKRLALFILAISSSLFAAILYLPNTTASVGFLIWEPWWYIRTMIVEPGRLNLLDWELRRQTYIVEHNVKRVVFLESISFLIFLFGNLGMRFIGFINIFKINSSLYKDYFNLTLLLIIFSSFILPLLFLQKGVASNSIQFIQYFLLFMGISAGIMVAEIIKKTKYVLIKIGISIFIIALAVPTQIGLIYDFYKRPPLAKITQGELQALYYLKENTNQNSIILTPPYDKYLHLQQVTQPIWAWFDTSYVSAISSRRIFLADSEQVDIMGYNLKMRNKILTEIFQETDPLIFKEKLIENSISYVYFPIGLNPKVNLLQTSLVQIYKNNSAEIWQVN